MAAGGTPQMAVQAVMLVFTAVTVMSGALLYGLGGARWGSYFRFVPYFVVAGFLAATGWFLSAGGVRMATGHALSLGGLTRPWTAIQIVNLAAAIGVLCVLLAVRRWIKSAFAMPLALVGMLAAGTIVLRGLGLFGPGHGFYLPSLGTLIAWHPFHAVRRSVVSWSMLIELIPRMLAVTIVALVSLVTKVSSIEVARHASGDLDRELRAHGLGCLIAAPFGGIASSLQVGTSRLLEHAGGATRMSGVCCALALGAVGISNFNLPGLVPIPIVTGLVFYLGYTFIADAFRRPWAQRAWLDLLLLSAMMIVSVRYGFLAGVVGGLICACIVFAFSYARVGVVHRHMTRADFAGHVVRSDTASNYLRETGDAIQIYWLSGYLFFGTSENLFERIRDDILALTARRVTHVILDFAGVPGADSSAVASLSKLRDFCEKRSITIVWCSLSAANRSALEASGLLGGKSRHKAFDTVPPGLEWCEEQLLAGANVDTDMGIAGFETWLQKGMGRDVTIAEFLAYLDKQTIEDLRVLYRQGDPADSISLVVAGHLAIDVAMPDGSSLRVRRIMHHTVLGEMGFFRHSARSANVSSDGPAVLFTLTRPNFERMRRERPDLAIAFHGFILNILVDRIYFANREIDALSV